MGPIKYPSLYQINTRVLLTQLSQKIGRRATLDDIPDSELDYISNKGFDWAWFLSVWQTGLAGQKVSRANPEWRKEFEETLPDLREADIAGSGFAITGYRVHKDLGGNEALNRLRTRLQKRGLKLMLDFVPNHTGMDHPWVEVHPEYYVRGSEAQLAEAPKNYAWANRLAGPLIFAYGRDPYFPGWPDTFQLNYGNPATQQAMIGELFNIAALCDGVRCDMAMLVLPDVFERTWGVSTQPFWPKATSTVREQFPEFTFMAEVYWDLEWTLQQQGFDYTYNKRLYDRLHEKKATSVRDHLRAELNYQNKMADFLENHDEQRAAVTFAEGVHEAAAIITFLTPGLRFFHQGQFEGRKKRISPHLVRGPEEITNPNVEMFYDRLLTVLQLPIVRNGQWQLLQCMPAWEGNWTSECYVVFAWQGADETKLLIVVNFAPNQSQSYLRLPFTALSNSQWRFQDLIGDAIYDRDGNDLQARGLYLDEPAWKAYVFSVTKIS
jgi:hypothetical protein